LRFRFAALAAILTLAATLVPTVAQAAQPASATASHSQAALVPAVTTKSCAATVSNARPVQNSKVVVSVKNLASGAAVTTTAKYKSKSTKKTTNANAKGLASTTYAIGPATHGFKVVITVAASKGSTRWTCKTSFTTR
jgi:hypothetical protein